LELNLPQRAQSPQRFNGFRSRFLCAPGSKVDQTKEGGCQKDNSAKDWLAEVVGGKRGMKNGHERVCSRGRLKLEKLKSLSFLAIFLHPLTLTLIGRRKSAQ